MGGRSTRLNQLFDKYKSQGMSDSEAMTKAISNAQKETMNARKADKKKKMEVISRAAKGLKSVFGPGHSPAGRKYLAGKVKKYGK